MAKPRGLGKGLDLMIPNVVGEEKKEKEKEEPNLKDLAEKMDRICELLEKKK